MESWKPKHVAAMDFQIYILRNKVVLDCKFIYISINDDCPDVF